MTLTDHDTAAELSATAADLDHARDMLDTLAVVLGGTEPVSLSGIARQLDAALRANRRDAITDANQLDVQALVIAEEAGELVGAYRRWAGKARRSGTLRELEAELADVLISTAVFACRAGIDLDTAVNRKAAEIWRRGWREEPPA
jgi:NTP pyrophosphatase (non-canonical NTP hydrolase)